MIPVYSVAASINKLKFIIFPKGCRCDNKSGGQRAVNPSWEYDRPDDPARFGIGRFEKDREGILVDGKKSVCTSALRCHDTANAFQMDRQTYRRKS